MTAKYEEDGDNFRRWGRMSSIWWKDLYDIIYGGGGGVASWFLDGVWRKGRNNENSSFCCDLRFNGGAMPSKFSSLFKLCADPIVCIAEMRW
uniref:Uncharacterized protein n=1 Tax=Medicago truncatula TaxID=3880 RepID=A2Q4L3_MEDTR|nr:hypothetical protein MtrDRAFT_AC157504g36v2 [Medicago truncatula]